MKRNVLNKLLLLRLLADAKKSKSFGIYGATRLQKLVFEIEFLGRSENVKTFNYAFKRWHYGPYSEEIKKDLKFLIEKELVSIDKENRIYKITEKGMAFINDKQKYIQPLYKEMNN